MNLLSRYVSWCEGLLENRLLLSLFILINLFGTIVGIVTYWITAEETNPLLWVFLIDCPLYVFLMTFVLLFRGDAKFEKMSFLVLYGLIKYGLWTISAWALHWQEIMVSNPEFYSLNLIVYIGHFGMILQCGFIARRACMSKGLEVWLPIGWMFLNDLFDYPLGLHPPLPDSRFVWHLFGQNIAMNILIPLFVFYVLRRSLAKER